MKTTIYLFVFLTTAVFAWAQDTIKTRYSGGFGYLRSSVENLRYSSLNTLLQEGSYNSLAPYSISFGGGGYFCFDNVVVGGEGCQFTAKTFGNGANTGKIQAGYGAFQLGYLFRLQDRMALYPSLGLGGGGFNIEIRENNSPEKLGELMVSPKGSMLLRSSGLLFQGKLSFQLFRRKQMHGWTAGVSLGYRLSAGAWKLNNSGRYLSDAPQVNLDGAFISLLLGGGGLFAR